MSSPKKIGGRKIKYRGYGLLVRAFSTKGGDPKRPPLIDELPFAEVDILYKVATRLHAEKKLLFKSTFIKLLNRATTPERQKEHHQSKPNATSKRSTTRTNGSIRSNSALTRN